jgi:hypothetical protein
MNFTELIDIVESKGTKPGERYFNSRQSEGPSGVTSSPIGKSNYNPEEREFKQKDPKDMGSAHFVNIFKVLTKAISLLKNDDTFEDQIKGILNGFKKNRYQISIEQETILKNYEKIIDKFDGQISQYTKRLFNASDTFYHTDAGKKVTEYKSSGAQDSSKEDLTAKLEEAKEKKAAYSEILEATRDEVENLSAQNEELNNEYLHQFITVIKYTTARLYKKLVAELGEDKQSLKTVVPMHELDLEMLDANASKDIETQLQLIEMLMSGDSETNPLLKFLDMEETNYDEVKQRAYHLRNGDNYSIILEQLYKNLPLFKLSNYYYSVILRKPALKLSTKQAKTLSSKNSTGGILGKLDSIKNEREFENLKPELLKYIEGLDISDTQKSALNSLVNGKFISRKGSPNAAFKIRSSLKASQITEKFDRYTDKVLESLEFDVDDFKIDMIEVFSKRK